MLVKYGICKVMNRCSHNYPCNIYILCMTSMYIDVDIHMYVTSINIYVVVIYMTVIFNIYSNTI